MNFLVFFVFLNLSFILESFADSICAKQYGSGVANKQLIGGWRYKSGSDLKQWDRLPEVMGVVKEMASKYNMESNSLMSLEPNNAQINEVYYQVVAGMNYCISFNSSSSECKNKVSENDVSCKAVFRCEGEAYQPLPILVQGALPGPEIEKTPNCVVV